MTRRHTPWLPLNQDQFLVARESTEHAGGVTTSETRSAYELPLSVRLVYDDETKLAGFEFRYAFEEQGRLLSLDGSRLTVGRHSLRVKSIEVPATVSEAETPPKLIAAALPRALRAIEQYIANPKRWRHAQDVQEDNLMVAKVAMHSKELPLLAYAVG